MNLPAELKPSEHQNQVAIFDWWDLAARTFGIDKRLLWAVPNGGARHPAVAAKLKAEGVRAGVPDLCLAVARGGFFGLYIENKVKPNKPKGEQAEIIYLLRRQHYSVVVCYSVEEAIRAIKAYLKAIPTDDLIPENWTKSGYLDGILC